MKNALLLLSWKVSLGLATAEMLVDAATNLLVAGSQSKAFALLAGENPRTAHFDDLLQYFITGLKDEGITRLYRGVFFASINSYA
jgi:hypothetical protein